MGERRWFEPTREHQIKGKSMTQFDFDEWANLYRTNPMEFERRRKALLDAEIAKAPTEHRINLRLLQSDLDELHDTLPPLHAAQVMSALMNINLEKLQSALLDLNIACNECIQISKNIPPDI